ncbi:MAG TPA: hypothetical protein VN476_10005, partial [Pyrinomonadaceae bacterium]|nr:hypothetical protein [Pyrinomonadaceae bacterium]
MNFNQRFRHHLFGLMCAALVLASTTRGVTPEHSTTAKDRSTRTGWMDSPAEVSDSRGPVYKWNLGENGLPLLGLAQERLLPGFDRLLTYPADQFAFPIFRSLVFDNEQNRYLMPASSRNGSSEVSVEFTRSGATNTYTTAEGMTLVDKGSLKTIQTADGTKFLFVQYPDGEFRCATIRQKTGGTLNLLYTANGLVLHGAVDSTGRSLTFNYGREGIRSLTQTWMSNLEGFTKTWSVGDDADAESSVRFAHAVGRKKLLPANALIHEYTAEMIASDKLLAQIFGGPNAVAGGNGFEPAGLAASYPFYRGDVIGDDGRLRNGHLSHAIHLYGAPDGRGDSPLYIPAGFTSHSSEPSPTDAAMVFYYPRLGNLTDVTLAVFHVADFQMVPEGNRVRIGNIGGPGGSSPLYKHSHIEFYRGKTG